MRNLLVICLFIGWSAIAQSSVWGGKALLSTHPKQRIFCYLNFPFAGGPVGLKASKFNFKIGEITPTTMPIVWLAVEIIKKDDGTYSLVQLFDADYKIDRKTPIDGSYTPNETEGTAVLEYVDRDGSLVNVSIAGVKTVPHGSLEELKNMKVSLEGTITPVDGQQVITFSAEQLNYAVFRAGG